MTINYLYKCTDCETVQAVNEDLGEASWILGCYSTRCQGMVKEHYRLDFVPLRALGRIGIICPKEVMSDDSDEDEAIK